MCILCRYPNGDTKVAEKSLFSLGRLWQFLEFSISLIREDSSIITVCNNVEVIDFIPEGFSEIHISDNAKLREIRNIRANLISCNNCKNLRTITNATINDISLRKCSNITLSGIKGDWLNIYGFETINSDFTIEDSKFQEIFITSTDSVKISNVSCISCRIYSQRICFCSHLTTDTLIIKPLRYYEASSSVTAELEFVDANNLIFDNCDIDVIPFIKNLEDVSCFNCKNLKKFENTEINRVSFSFCPLLLESSIPKWNNVYIAYCKWYKPEEKKIRKLRVVQRKVRERYLKKKNFWKRELEEYFPSGVAEKIANM